MINVMDKYLKKEISDRLGIKVKNIEIRREVSEDHERETVNIILRDVGIMGRADVESVVAAAIQEVLSGE